MRHQLPTPARAMVLGISAVVIAFASVLVASLATTVHSCAGGFFTVPVLSIFAFNVGVPCAIAAFQVGMSDETKFARLIHQFEVAGGDEDEIRVLLFCSCVFAVAHAITFPLCTPWYTILAIPVLSACLTLATSFGLVLLILYVHHYQEKRRAETKRHADIDAAARLVRESPETRVADIVSRAKSPRRRAH